MAQQYAILTCDEEIKTVIKNRIVPRMREIDLCAKVSRFMFDEDCGDGIKSFETASFKLSGKEFYSNIHSRQLTDPILDTGIAMVRALLQIFGFTVNKNGEFHEYKNSKETDILFISFGEPQPVLDENEDNYLFKCLEDREIEAIKVTALNGNKGVAHLTVHETKSIPLDQLSEACFAIIKLLNFWLVEPKLGEQVLF